MIWGSKVRFTFISHSTPMTTVEENDAWLLALTIFRRNRLCLLFWSHRSHVFSPSIMLYNMTMTKVPALVLQIYGQEKTTTTTIMTRVLAITKGYGVQATTIKVKTLLLHGCALSKFHVRDSQNTRDQITSERMFKYAWQIAFCAFHSCLMEVQTATYGDACVITTWRLGLWVPLVDRNSGPSLFMNWIKQYFASGFQNYRYLFSSDYGHYGHTKRLHFMETVNSKISEQRAKGKARWKKKSSSCLKFLFFVSNGERI